MLILWKAWKRAVDFSTLPTGKTTTAAAVDCELTDNYETERLMLA